MVDGAAIDGVEVMGDVPLPQGGDKKEGEAVLEVQWRTWWYCCEG